MNQIKPYLQSALVVVLTLVVLHYVAPAEVKKYTGTT